MTARQPVWTVNMQASGDSNPFQHISEISLSSQFAAFRALLIVWPGALRFCRELSGEKPVLS